MTDNTVEDLAGDLAANDSEQFSKGFANLHDDLGRIASEHNPYLEPTLGV